MRLFFTKSQPSFILPGLRMSGTVRHGKWHILHLSNCLGIMSLAREYEGRLRFGQKLYRGGPLKL